MFTGLSLSWWNILVCVLNFQKIRAALKQDITLPVIATWLQFATVFCLINKREHTQWPEHCKWHLIISCGKVNMNAEKKSFQLHMQRIDQSCRYLTDATKRSKNSPTLSLLELLCFHFLILFPYICVVATHHSPEPLVSPLYCGWQFESVQNTHEERREVYIQLSKKIVRFTFTTLSYLWCNRSNSNASPKGAVRM